jgi:putative flippase GtrA
LIRAAHNSQVVRFLLSGGTGFALYLAFALLLRHGTTLGEGTCAFVATLLAIPPTFLLQRSFTFRSSGRAHRQLAGYLLLQLLSSVVIGVVAHAGARLGLPQVAGFVVAGVAGVVVSYLVQAAWIFRH